MDSIGKNIRTFTDLEVLVRFSDEVLCGNAQQGCEVSRHILWSRYSNYISRIVYRENQRHNIPQYEISDALQELYFAFHTAVQRYESNYCKRKSASFKTFLSIVIVRKFSNYCTLWRIYQKRIILDLDDEALQDFAMRAINRVDYSPMDWEGILLNEFSSERLANALCRLRPKERHLLQTWLKYGRDKEVAQVMGITPAAAKLRRERLFRRFKKSIVEK